MLYINNRCGTIILMKRKLLRLKAQKLRKAGHTYSEIINKLKIKIPKSTLSSWCKDIKLPSTYKNKIVTLNKENLNKARLKALVVNKEKRKKYLAMLSERNIPLLKRLDKPVQKLVLAVLYLGEGAKYTSNQCLTLGSSDPRIIKFYMALLKNCYKISNDKFRVRIQCRFDQNVKQLEDFWRRITKIDPTQFYPTYVDRRTKGKKTLKKNYKGVCTIHYFSTEIQLELELLASAIMKYITQGR